MRGAITGHSLGIYYRLNDVAVRSMYGPSADEGGL